MAHPVLTPEEDLRMYLKARAQAALQWILLNRPVRASFRALMFSEPTPNAQAQLFSFNGVSFDTRFFGMVRSQPVEYKIAQPEKPRIITPHD